jgi:hypothetical protein
MIKVILLIFIIVLSINLYSDDLFLESENYDDDNSTFDISETNIRLPIQYNEPPKSAAKAMLFSAIFPGAGQFYVSKKNWTAYFFAAVEIGLWVAMSNQIKKGDDLTVESERFADENFNLEHQYWVQWHMMDNHGRPGNPWNPPNDLRPGDPGFNWGNGANFRLNKSDPQHYYEDIGKYDKYIFGWNDWYGRFVGEIAPGIVSVNWVMDGDVWLGNIAITGTDTEAPFSGNRQRYIYMRQKFEKHYSNARSYRYYILLNHVLAVADAARVTNEHNKSLIVTPELTTRMINDNLTPFLGVNVGF